jgi:hypothetical protein
MWARLQEEEAAEEAVAHAAFTNNKEDSSEGYTSSSDMTSSSEELRSRKRCRSDDGEAGPLRRSRIFHLNLYFRTLYVKFVSNMNYWWNSLRFWFQI